MQSRRGLGEVLPRQVFTESIILEQTTLRLRDVASPSPLGQCESMLASIERPVSGQHRDRSHHAILDGADSPWNVLPGTGPLRHQQNFNKNRGI